MKLITFDDGHVGRLELEERLALDDIRLRAPIVPKKFFHTSGNFRAHEDESKNVDWPHPLHKGIVRMSVSLPHLVAHHSPQGYSAGAPIATGTVQSVAGFGGDRWEEGHGTPVPQKADW
ncbi:hypothetical protein AB5J49_45850 [Streptomyces sp. R28]|uniref:Uncharacterized protein n=1 Tax=Streptomyces sp. R28 TaxID=3238628 RepID=A0AB39QEX2_9ACTN